MSHLGDFMSTHPTAKPRLVSILFKPAILLLNTLSYPRKLLLVSFLFLLPLIVVMMVLAAELNGRIGFSQNELAGTEYLRPLRELFERALRGRGLAARVEDGDIIVRPQLIQKHGQIDDALKELRAVDERLGGKLNTTTMLGVLEENWRFLRQRQAADKPEVNDTLNAGFLGEIGAMVSHVGDMSNLILDPDLDTYYLMDAALLKLPEAAGLGGVAASRLRFGVTSVNPVIEMTRTALISHASLMRSNREATRRGLEVAFRNHRENTGRIALEKSLEDFESATDALIKTLIAAAGDNDRKSMLPEQYDELIDRQMRATFDLWDRAVAELDRLLQSRIDRLAQKRDNVQIFAGVMVAVVAYLLIAFYISVMRTVHSLADTTNRMVSGDFSETFMLETRDELGQVAVSFNQIATQLRAERDQAREDSDRATTAEAMVREKEFQTRRIIDTALDGVVIMSEKGVITGWNAQATAIFGWIEDEVKGRRVGETIIPHRYREAHEIGLAKFLSSGEGPVLNQRIEISALRKSGEEFPIELAISPTRTPEGYFFSAFVRDITSRKKAEEEIKSAKEAAEAANRAKSAFLATMSHEIRTPMNAVIGMTGLLLDTELNKEQREFAQIVRTSADSLLTIINDILDFSKIEASTLELEQQPFDLHACVEAALDQVTTTATDKNLELGCLFEKGVPDTVIGDVTRLRQVLVNLLANAVKFTEKGEVIVGVQSRPLGDSRFEIQFGVRDTGIGIPADRMDRLFRSFSQVDASTTRKYGGTGLGLAISKKLAECMGGKMWVESVVDKGSTFFFTIIATGASTPVSLTLQNAQAELRGRRVMVVDDNATNRRIVRLQAESWGMLVEEFADGPSALAGIDRGEQFDLAVLDGHMPGMDGATLAREIQKRPAASRMVLVALSSMGRREAEVEDGLFKTYLTKPIKQSLLFDALMQAISTDPVASTQPQVKPQFDKGMASRLPLRILVAEDVAVNQKLIQSLLGRLGYRADIAGNGLEVLAAIERQRYDLILMDMQMPEMDGIEATKRVRSHLPADTQPRIVALTANAMDGDRERCEEAGMDGYLAKPVQVRELQAELNRAGMWAQQRKGNGGEKK